MEHIIIGISGPSASGKSLLSNTIVNEMGSDQVAVISEDLYYKDLSHLPIEEREQVNFDHPESIDHNKLTHDLLELKDQKNIHINKYDYSSHTKLETKILINSHKILVLEGILIFAIQDILDLLDIKIYVDTPLDICLCRRIKRDIMNRQRTVLKVIEQYEKTVRPMYTKFIEPYKRYSDIIVPSGGENRIAIELIKSKIKAILGE